MFKKVRIFLAFSRFIPTRTKKVVANSQTQKSMKKVRKQQDYAEDFEKGIPCNREADFFVGGKVPADVEHGAEQGRG